ncbi:MAG: cytochrome c biogenesis protein ResB [Geobacteraceae bacterium]|nr:cytochrome c biogenesis protein ResB [Geobacteraceae bacterium]
MSTNKPSFIESVWDFFCSLKLSIALLIGLAITSIIGTIVPQGNIPPEYLQTISESKFKLYQGLSFFDMYHSWWFMLLLYMLTVNLVACSIKRLPRVWKIVSEPQLLMDEKFEKSLSLTHEVKVSGDSVAKMKSFLKDVMGEPVVTERDGAIHLFVQKTPWCRLGVYVVHLSIIIIFVGALLGSFFGYKAFINIPEGEAIDTVYTQKEKPIKLDFAVKLEKFSVSYYNTGAPKEFKSMLTVLENGKPVPGLTNRPTIVNDPLSYKGVTFYQSSYGQSGEGAAYHFNVAIRGRGEGVHLDLKKGEQATLTGGAKLEVLEATQDVRQFMPEFSGPAAKVKLQMPGKAPESFIVFKNHPEIEDQRKGELVIQYAGADEKLYTGLQVAKDPGVNIVWLGCALMTIGIFMAFFLSHNRLWIRISGGRAVLGGTASKNPAAFERKFEEYVEKFKKL